MFAQRFENVKRYISAYYYYIIIILPLEKRPSREGRLTLHFICSAYPTRNIPACFVFLHSSLPTSIPLLKKKKSFFQELWSPYLVYSQLMGVIFEGTQKSKKNVQSAQ